MISQKPDVTIVTIIDNNQEVLDIFTTYILRQFPNKDKVKTIKSDALEYLRTYDLTIYDYINVDNWYDTIDMIFTYLRCLEIEKANPTVKFSYWLENDLKVDIQTAILSEICDFPTLGYLTDKIGADIVQETPLRNYQDVYELVDIKNLRELLYRWYCNHFEVVELYESKDIALLNQIHKTTSLIRNKHKK